MPDVPVDPQFWQYPNELREKAEALLQQGDAPNGLGSLLSAEALAVLYRLARLPDSASDGLKLLHELQTHQIELELQYEQSQANEQEIAVQLARYRALYESAPAGYLIISREGRILECNTAGADLLGMPGDELSGYLFDACLAPASRATFNWKLKKLFNGTAREACTVYTAGTTDSSTDSANAEQLALRVLATLAPDSEVVLVNLMDLEGSQPE